MIDVQIILIKDVFKKLNINLEDYITDEEVNQIFEIVEL